MTNLTSFQLYLVRHGQSEANLAHQWQGWGDAPLTELGVSQARNTGQMLSEIPFVLAVSSDRLRARQTAETILAQLKVPPALTLDHRIRERFYGGFENLTTPEVLGHFPHGIYDPERDYSRMQWRPRGGETLDDVMDRVMTTIVELASRISSGDQVLLITHGNILRLFHAVALGLSDPDLRIPANASTLVVNVTFPFPEKSPQISMVSEPIWED